MSFWDKDFWGRVELRRLDAENADALVYFSFWFSARLPAWKKPGSDEVIRSPRMNPIRKEGVG
jgi:hypothetical protein